jgi:endonuclease-3
MNRKEKAKKIGGILDGMYKKTPIPLDHTSDYTLLVAVMLSAQTTDKKSKSSHPKSFQAGRYSGENVSA